MTSGSRGSAPHERGNAPRSSNDPQHREEVPQLRGTDGDGTGAIANPDDQAREGTLASGYSHRSGEGGTGGDVMQQGQSGHRHDPDRAGGEDRELAGEGSAGGAAGAPHDMPSDRDRAGRRLSEDETKDETMSGAATVTGVSGVSGGGSGTTSGAGRS
jgi:hypothetical protein